VALDLAPVDAALLVAPVDERPHGVGHLVVETGRRCVAGVVAVADDDRVVGDADIGGAGRVSRAARRREVAERDALRGLCRDGLVARRRGRRRGARVFTTIRTTRHGQKRSGYRDRPTGTTEPHSLSLGTGVATVMW